MPVKTRSLTEIIANLECATSKMVLTLERELMNACLDQGEGEFEARDTVRCIMSNHVCARDLHQPWGARIRGDENTWWCDWCGKRQFSSHEAVR